MEVFIYQRRKVLPHPTHAICLGCHHDQFHPPPQWPRSQNALSSWRVQPFQLRQLEGSEGTHRITDSWDEVIQLGARIANSRIFGG